MEHLFVGILAALFGALAHWLLPTLIEWRHTREVASKLTGDWFSSYQGPDEPEGTWIEELINIRVPFFSSQVLLKNRDSSHSYSYIASGFIKNDYIYGKGGSVRPAAHAPGAFMLTKAAPPTWEDQLLALLLELDFGNNDALENAAVNINLPRCPGFLDKETLLLQSVVLT